MDLNKPLNLSFSLKGIDIANAKLPFAISLISVLGVLLFGYFSYGIYSNYEVHAVSKAQYETLIQQKLMLQEQRNKVFKQHADLIDELVKSPSSKSELAAVLSSLVAKNGMKIGKLASNDSGSPSVAKDAAIELEADGSFSSIRSFLAQARAFVLASDVIYLKISKSKDARLLHLSFAVKYTQPPKLEVPKQKVAFMIKGQQYFYDTFDRWKMRQTGFVQAPEVPAVEKPTEVASPLPVGDLKRNDPFQAPPQPFVNKDGQIQADPAGVQPTHKKNNVMYLSGIIYSPNKKFCIVVFPSGESKVFAEGEKINGKITVNRISDEGVTFTGKKTNQFKVGQELPL